MKVLEMMGTSVKLITFFQTKVALLLIKEFSKRPVLALIKHRFCLLFYHVTNTHLIMELQRSCNSLQQWSSLSATHNFPISCHVSVIGLAEPWLDLEACWRTLIEAKPGQALIDIIQSEEELCVCAFCVQLMICIIHFCHFLVMCWLNQFLL